LLAFAKATLYTLSLPCWLPLLLYSNQLLPYSCLQRAMLLQENFVNAYSLSTAAFFSNLLLSTRLFFSILFKNLSLASGMLLHPFVEIAISLP
jgi:hypothetical protein